MGLDSNPVALYPNYIASQPTMLVVKQHFSTTDSGDFTCFRSDSSVLFEVVGQQKSTSRCRELVDPATGESLFQLRRRYLNLKEQWYLEFPEDEQSSRQPKFSVAMKWKGRANFDITMDNAAASKAESITLEIPGAEAPGETARIRNKPAWEMDVVAGIDLAIVCINYRSNIDRQQPGEPLEVAADSISDEGAPTHHASNSTASSNALSVSPSPKRSDIVRKDGSPSPRGTSSQVPGRRGMMKLKTDQENSNGQTSQEQTVAETVDAAASAAAAAAAANNINRRPREHQACARTARVAMGPRQLTPRLSTMTVHH
ncbi:hypothetical protein D0867_03579 [Hortaea werneckii]|uniref:Uncharacterized protein n=1 Tax=Hortaea werneckii TaxID=91943 RepID=A0A3M7A0P0_HORWE|nr:hypothetical protein D0867_03579 [Hortaea werneckii]RMY28100.1 hypothetical protein D0866_09663 [Hortaea werneckii]